jgi:AraC-like DNA-binding protein
MYLGRTPRAAQLAGFVHTIEYVQDEPGTERERMIPGGDVSLVVTLVDDGFDYETPCGERCRAPGACLAGPQRYPQVVSTKPQQGLVAVNFAPGGARPFFPVPLSAATDAYLPLSDLWGRDGAGLRERLLETGSPEQIFDEFERLLLGRVVNPLEPDRAVILAVHALDRGERVGEVIERFGTTAKPFIRRFTAATGLTPKRYARIRRIQRLLPRIPADGPVDWARLAVEQGFYDQSHLIHDFTEITGVQPSRYRPRSPDALNHLPC